MLLYGLSHKIMIKFEFYLNLFRDKVNIIKLKVKVRKSLRLDII